MSPTRRVHGDDLLYRFFQDALESHPDLFAAVPQLLISTTGVWLPLETYRRWPVLLPWVVRDPKCRGNTRRGVPDQWSSPDARGYLRDDNSLVKSLPRALDVRGQRGSHIHGARLGTEFVAAHIWRVVEHADLASRHPILNTFVPNLVWLPQQVAKLTDREGSIVQRTVQAMAYALYRREPVPDHLHDVVEEAWAMLPEPSIGIDPLVPGDLNWFQPTERFYATRVARLQAVTTALEHLERGEPIVERVVTRRYAAGLPTVSADARHDLLAHLRAFAEHP